jgi:hypothetical protein
MKTTIHRILIVASLAAVSIAQAQSEAQVASQDPAAITKSDPFIKGKDATKPKLKAELPVMPPNGGIRFVFETYSMSLTDFDALLTPETQSAAMWESVQKAVTEKKATLDAVQSVVTKSGQRATLASTDELRYATEFAPTATGVLAPTAWEMKPCGDLIEIDPMLAADHTSVEVNLSIQAVRFIKWTEDKAEPPAVSSTQPLFIDARYTSAVMVPLDQTFFIGTLTQPSATGLAEADSAERATFVFVRPTLLPMAKPTDDHRADQQLRFAFRTYRLERATAAALLRAHADSEALLKAVQDLVKGDNAQLESLTTGTSRSGQRASIEESATFQHGTKAYKEEDAKAAPNAPAIHGFTAFERKFLGHRLEWDAVASLDPSYCDINLAPEFIEYRGPVSGHPLIEKQPEMPVFASRNIQTAVSVTVGHTAFIGTMNQPRDTGVNGRKDDGKTCLQFVEVVAW